MINLRHNQITDIKAFEHHDESSNLGRLFLEDNPIAYYSPLRDLQLVDHDLPILDGWEREDWDKERNDEE